jgi:glycosyltransferase involved in cell wall biosynthesis
MSSLWVVIAAFNEEKAIAAVVKDLHKHGLKNIIVVDDGSKDKTADVAQEAGATVVRHVINRGQGAALKTGIEGALDKSADAIVTFDADGQMRAEDITPMAKHVLNGDVDVVLGSRFLKTGSNVPLVRKFSLKMGAILFRLLYGVKVTDSHCGFRVFSRHAAEVIQITADRMEHASEIIDQIGKHKLRYQEFPVIIRYTEYSKAHSAQGTFPAIRIFIKTVAHKFLR